MKILVTGANGFIGSALCADLSSSGESVKRAVRVHDGMPNTCELDETTDTARVKEIVRDVDCIVHLAARVHVVEKHASKHQPIYQQTNVEFTRRLAMTAREAGVRRFVFVSSIKVCGDYSPRKGFTEGDVPDPKDAYSSSKMAAEQVLRDIGRTSGLEVVIMRPPLVYGEGVKANFRKLLAAVRIGFPLPFLQLTNTRSLIYLGNLVSALKACVRHPDAAGETFHVCDNGPVTLPELIGELSAAMGREPRVFSLSKSMIAGTGKAFGLFQMVDSLTNDLVADSGKIRRVLSWSPPHQFSEGIRRTVAWYLGGEKQKQNLWRTYGVTYPKVCELCAVDFTLKHLLLPLVDGMQDYGWGVTSVCSDGKYVAELREQGYRIQPINISRNLFNLTSHALAIWRLYKLFLKESFDVLHVHTPVAALLARVAGRFANVPLVIYTAHGFYFHDEMPKWKYRFFVALERLCRHFTDAVFTQSSEDAQVAVSTGIAKKKDIMAIGNGVNVNMFRPISGERKLEIRKRLGVPADACVIGVVSRLVKEKGLVEFLDAAIELSRQFETVCFLLVGERLKSDHDASIERELLAARETLGARLVTTGYRSDVVDMLGAMDIFCLPSYREGMPRSIIEAMMMSLPVVATNIRGSREEVVHGETGLLVQTHSSTAIANALRTFLENPNIAKKMAEAGRARALKLYDERTVVSGQIASIAQRLRECERTGDIASSSVAPGRSPEKGTSRS